MDLTSSKRVGTAIFPLWLGPRREAWKFVVEVLFVAWVVVVNFLYYAQFRTLIITRFGYLLHR